MAENQTGGRLAQVIATRGGLAPPEAPFVIEHREALYYMLCEAAELEHAIMCQYLYAAFSLKQSEDEGLSPGEAEAVQRWRKRISRVATQEMLHLSLVQNLLSAIGGAPHLSRPNFPHPATEAFGGPAAGDGASGRPSFTEEQRARWVALAIRSADDAKLPADPPFRAALTSYLEWTSRAGGTSPPPWDWGPAGPPAEEPAPASTADDQEAITLPGPDETVSFAAHIKPLFREHDRQSTSFAFDLWSRDDVQAHAADILGRLTDGTMPCDGAWPAERVEVFRRWTESGCQP